jgi:hypothetical protein
MVSTLFEVIVQKGRHSSYGRNTLLSIHATNNGIKLREGEACCTKRLPAGFWSLYSAERVSFSLVSDFLGESICCWLAPSAIFSTASRVL